MGGEAALDVGFTAELGGRCNEWRCSVPGMVRTARRGPGKGRGQRLDPGGGLGVSGSLLKGCLGKGNGL